MSRVTGSGASLGASPESVTFPVTLPAPVCARSRTRAASACMQGSLEDLRRETHATTLRERKGARRRLTAGRSCLHSRPRTGGQVRLYIRRRFRMAAKEISFHQVARDQILRGV